jgi:pyruvate/2-oxoglutarate dehydrogenase complex dihydrolipoamide acyltransferase (E2) component
MKSARLLEWLKKPGDRIEPYELLFRVETDSLLESQPAGVSHRLDIECCDPAVFAKALVEPGSEEILPDTPIAVLCEHPDDIPHIDGAQGGNTMVWQAYLSSKQ